MIQHVTSALVSLSCAFFLAASCVRDCPEGPEAQAMEAQRGWNLQQINNGGNTTGPSAVEGVFIWVNNNQHHWAYRDGGGILWDSWWDGDAGQWKLQQINGSGGLTSGPVALSDPFASVFHNQQHIGYRAAGGEIWDSWYDGDAGRWKLQKINTDGMTRGPRASTRPAIWVNNNQQHWAYNDGGGILWDSWWDGDAGRWKLQQINGSGGVAGGPPAAADAFPSVFHNQQHIGYRTAAGVIWDSWYDGDAGRWKLQQINGGGHTTGPRAIDGMSIWVNNNQQHWAYRDGGGIIWDSWWDGDASRWKLQQINGTGGLTNGPVALSDPFASVFHNQQHIGYRATNGEIWDSWYDGDANAWNPQRINKGGRTQGSQAADTVFVSVFHDQQHFGYRDARGTIQDSWWDGASGQSNCGLLKSVACAGSVAACGIACATGAGVPECAECFAGIGASDCVDCL